MESGSGNTANSMGPGLYNGEVSALDALTERRDIAIGRTITLFKNARELSTCQLSELSLIDSVRLKRLEKGTCAMSVDELARVSKTFNVSQSEFLIIADGICARWRR